MATHQYMDLPLIPGFTSEEPQYIGWGQEHLALHSAATFWEPEFTYMESAPEAMRTHSMKRFLLDTSPLTPGLLRANLHNGILHKPQHSKILQRCPGPEQPRYDSPDRTSVSGNSSYAAQTEIRSPRTYPVASYDSPDDYNYSVSPYPAIGRVKQDSFLSEFSHTGGNVNLRDLELYNHEPEPESMVEGGDAAGIKVEIDGTYDPDPGYPMLNSGQAVVKASSDSDTNHSMRDAESVQPMEPSEGESSDADYTPNQSSRRRRSSASTNSSGRLGARRRSLHGRKGISMSAPRSSRINKKGTKGAGKVRRDSFSDSQRYFPCPLTMYGCTSTFSSKNEWKRHIGTQHIKLGFWRCDLCSTTVDPHDHETVYHNDFNRKDLFTQHLRRMHAAPPNQSHRSQKDYPVTEDNIGVHQKRCFQLLRETPVRSKCLYCDETFTGPGSWDSRVEHIGRHLEKDRKAGNMIGDVETWNKDMGLERWLFNEGIITRDEAGEWKIGDGRPRRQGVDDDTTSDEDI